MFLSFAAARPKAFGSASSPVTVTRKAATRSNSLATAVTQHKGDLVLYTASAFLSQGDIDIDAASGTVRSIDGNVLRSYRPVDWSLIGTVTLNSSGFSGGALLLR